MERQASTQPTRGLSLDRGLERMRQQHARLTPLLIKRSDASTLEAFDLETERLITEVFGETSEMLEAYESAQLGEASSLVNVPEEAQEGGVQDSDQGSLHLRRRVLENCIAELEARRAAAAQKQGAASQLLIGPQIADHMTPEIRSVPIDATLKQASHLMQEWRIGSLLVADGRYYVGIITDTDLAREVVARGLDATTTSVRGSMRQPPITIESSQPIIEAVRLMKDKATRHLAVTEHGEIIGVLSVSNILRYYSGVV
ncbi:MAG: cyclic nucleotide-binding/CBS domain-containing protein [Nitrospiraceae bacterium]